MSHFKGCVQLYKEITRKGQQSASGSGGLIVNNNVANHHLYLRIVDSGSVGDIVVYCQLYSSTRATWVSERWCCVSGSGQHTLFTDVNSVDHDEVYCVFTVYRIGRVNQQVRFLCCSNRVYSIFLLKGESQQRKSVSGRSLSDQLHSNTHKRPVSVGVCPLTGLIGATAESEHEITETIKMFSCDERDFHQLQTLIIKNSTKLNPASILTGPNAITVTFRVFTGVISSVRTQNQDLFSVNMNYFS